MSVFRWPARVYWEDTDGGGIVIPGSTTLVCHANYDVMRGLVDFLVAECCTDAERREALAGERMGRHWDNATVDFDGVRWRQESAEASEYLVIANQRNHRR